MLRRTLYTISTISIIFLCQCTLFKSNIQTTCSSIAEVNPHLTANCLFVSDFDNTLFECVDENHGSDQWFSEGINHLIKKENFTPNLAVEKMIQNFEIAHETALMRPVEKETIPLLQTLTKKSIKTVILTSRHIITQTQRELNNIQDATVSSVSFSPFHMGTQKIVTFELTKEKAVYQEGILYCGNNDKGEALTTLLKHLNLKPAKIIFIDDKEKHVTSVERAAKSLNIPFIGLRYTYLDKKINLYKFDPLSIHAHSLITNFSY